MNKPEPRHIIACEVFRHELELLTSHSKGPELHFLRQGLHDTPDILTAELQKAVDGLESAGVREIHLCYGLCGRGLAGIRARRATLIVPKVHDCIPLLLGDRTESDKSIYWMSAGWLQYSQLPFLREKKKRQREYVEKFGEDSAAYLMEMEEQWLKNYTSARLICWQNVGNRVKLERAGKFVAARARLPFSECGGSPEFLQALLDGGKDERFVRIPPGAYLDIAGNGSLVVLRNS